MLLFSIFLVLSCSSDDNTTTIPNTTVPPALSITVTVVAITDHTAVLNWVVEGNTSPVTFEIVIDGQEVADGIDGNQYILTDLDETTTYEGKVFAKEQNNNQTFDDYTFTTSTDFSYEGDFQINSQEEVDDFYFTSISGCLNISGTDITNLSNLSTLQEVGCLFIYSTNLTSLEGLNNLQNLTGNAKRVEFIQNYLLTDVSAISSLGTQIKTLQLKNNTSLVNLTGLGTAEDAIELKIINSAVEDLSMFNNMQQIDRLWLLDLPNLISITGFNGLESFTGAIRMENLPNLITLNAFNSITILHYGLSIENLPSLVSLEGFNSLTNISNNGFIIKNNVNLESINGFENLTTIDGGFLVMDCENLQNLGDFTSLSAIPGGLTLKNLPSLANITALSQLNSIGNSWVGMKIENCENLISLEGLNNLVNLDGPLFLKDLNNLQSISALGNAQMNANENYIQLINLNNLLSLSGLNNVQTLHTLTLDGLNSLTNLEGLNNLTEVEYGFRIENMNNLNSLNGLENLTSAASYYWDEFSHSSITFDNLPQLTNLNALLSLTFIGALYIRNCESLTNLDGFDNVYQTFNAGAIFSIYNNSNLTNFCGLSLYANSNERHAMQGSQGTSQNAYNPTWEQIKSTTECSQ